MDFLQKIINDSLFINKERKVILSYSIYHSDIVYASVLIVTF